MSIVECDDVFKAAADKIAQGKIIEWARGRSEFGPRGLGNRSILGAPRSRENWRRINPANSSERAFARLRQRCSLRILMAISSRCH
ncbi:carbamoyltransferase C-terminal domain-containing protein [Mesorhizobium sp. M0633]|uniref:carbamoyltransferase C-terminal domain-containing protein n=1 Tax=Mesorhizobium sp. M0633 TaxID=2956977 RepID=UPI003334DE6E